VALTERAGDDAASMALDYLVETLEQIEVVAQQALARAELLERQREEGGSYRQIMSNEERPLLVELVSRMIDVLIDAGGQFRRAEASALYDEGATMDEIGALFGVSRQRVSALLASARKESSSV
jgi:DNA-directed RNA polymerase sigma subunit (sigma70/sigma32)